MMQNDRNFRLIHNPYVILIAVTALMFGWAVQAEASIFHQIPFEFISFSEGDLDYSDSADDNNTGSTPLGFSVTLGGATYSYFDMDSNGYIQLLTGAAHSPTEYGYGGIDDLIDEDPTSTYLLSAYDDLSSYDYGFYGYKVYGDMVIFYYDTETYDDGGYELLNNFEVILYDDGRVQWNFNYADYDIYGYDLYSGLYFGNTETRHELYRETIPQRESWIYGPHSHEVIPEPSSLGLLGMGLLGLWKYRKKTGSNEHLANLS